MVLLKRSNSIRSDSSCPHDDFVPPHTTALNLVMKKRRILRCRHWNFYTFVKITCVFFGFIGLATLLRTRIIVYEDDLTVELPDIKKIRVKHLEESTKASTGLHMSSHGSISGCLICNNATSLEACFKQNIFDECEKGECETDYLISVQTGDILVSRACKTKCNRNVRAGVSLTHQECLQSAVSTEHCYSCAARVQRERGCFQCDGAASFGECDALQNFGECSFPMAKCESHIRVNPQDGTLSITRKCAPSCAEDTVEWQDCVASAGHATTCNRCENIIYHQITQEDEIRKTSLKRSKSPTSQDSASLTFHPEKKKSTLSSTTHTTGCFVCINATSMENCDQQSTFTQCTNADSSCVTNHFVDSSTGDVLINRTCEQTCVDSLLSIQDYIATADSSEHHYACSKPVTANTGCIVCQNEASLQKCQEFGRFESCNSRKALCKLDILASSREGEISVSRSCSESCTQTSSDWQECVATAEDSEKCTTCQKMTYKAVPYDTPPSTTDRIPQKKSHRLKRSSVHMKEGQENKAVERQPKPSAEKLMYEKEEESTDSFTHIDVVMGCFMCSNYTSLEECEKEAVFTACSTEKASCLTDHFIDPATGEVLVSQSCKEECEDSTLPIGDWFALTDTQDHHYACSQTLPGNAGCIVCKNETSIQSCQDNGRFEVCSTPNSFCKLDIAMSREHGELLVSQTCSPGCSADTGDWQQCIATAERDDRCTTCLKMSYKPMNGESTMRESTYEEAVARFKRQAAGGDNGSGSPTLPPIPASFTCSTQTSSLSVEEGGATQQMKVTVNESPSVVCTSDVTTCSVTMTYSVNTSTWPACDSGTMEQMYLENGCSAAVTVSTYAQPFYATVRGAVDMVVDGDHSSEVTARMVIERDGDTSTIDCDGQTQVAIRDSNIQGSVCSVTSNFLAQTFDYGLYSPVLSPMEQGPYLVGYHAAYRMYKHTTLPYEVQVMFASCFPWESDFSESCACAVNVRCEDTVIVLDNCFQVNSPSTGNYQDQVTNYESVLRVFAYSKLGETFPSGLKVEQQDETLYYKITLPSGTSVHFNPTGGNTGSSINVLIKPSPLDVAQTQGMCGNFDQDASNDFLVSGTPDVHDFVQSNQLTLQDNLFPFDNHLYTQSGSASSSSVSTPTYCSCTTTDQSCTNFPVSVKQCDAFSSLLENVLSDLIVFDPSASASSTRKKRSKIGYSNILIKENYVPQNLTFRNGWNESTATSYCNNLLTASPLDGACNTSTNNNQSNAMLLCVRGILVTGSTNFSQVPISSLQDNCRVLLEETMVTQSNQPKINTALNNLCPNDCSGQGTCVRGKCNCTDTWRGVDCSVAADAEPHMTNLPNHGLCAIRERNCSIIVVYGQNFLPAIGLTCHLQPTNATENFTVPAQFVHKNEIRCHTGYPRNYLVGITKDPSIAPTIRLLFHPYDFACDSCQITNKSAQCLPLDKNSHCLIDDTCYAPGQKNSNDSCLVCDPSRGYSNFSTSMASECLPITTTTSTATAPPLATFSESAVAGMVTGAVLGVALLFSTCFCCWWVIAARRRRREEEEEEEEEERPQFTFFTRYNALPLHRNLINLKDDDVSWDSLSAIHKQPRRIPNLYITDYLDSSAPSVVSSESVRHPAGYTGGFGGRLWRPMAPSLPETRNGSRSSSRPDYTNWDWQAR